MIIKGRLARHGYYQTCYYLAIIWAVMYFAPYFVLIVLTSLRGSAVKCRSKPSDMTLTNFLRTEEPLGLLLSSAIFTGALPDAVQPKYRKFTVAAGIFFHVMLLSFMGCSLCNILTAENFFEESTESCHFLIAGAHFLVTQLFLQFKQARILKIFDDIREIWLSSLPRHKALMDETLSRVKRTIFGFYFVCVVMVTISIAVTGVLENMFREELKLPVQIWIPFSYREHFFLAILWEMTLYNFSLMIAASTTSFFYSLTLHIYAIGTALGRDIEMSDVSDHRLRILYIERHVKIMKMISTLSEHFSATWAFEVFCATIQYVFPLYGTLKAMREGNMEFYHRCLIMVINIFTTYMSFGAGHLIKLVGDNLRESFYNQNWYDGTVAEQKETLFALTVNRGHSYRFRWFWTFNREGFLSVLQGNYSYVMMLLFFESQVEQ